MGSFERRSTMPVPGGELFAWHARPGAFERLVPPWDDVRVVRRTGGLEPGSEVELRMHLGPIPLTWLARHTELEEGTRFCDEQVRGPFKTWRHEHIMEDRGNGSSTLVDRIEWRPPAFERLARAGIEERLNKMFDYRHDRTERDLRRHAAFAELGKKRVVISGASGLVGSALASFLSTGGHDVVRLVRREAEGPGELRWDPERGEIDRAGLGHVDAFIHLSGENVGEGRWSEARKRSILESRTKSTELIARVAAEVRPEVLLVASAIGLYGDRGDAWVDENSERGTGFLADVCEAWEGAAEPARAAGVRTAHLRLGVVLSPKGGALAKLLPIFRLGAGGPVGNGRQYMSWVSLDDVVYAFHEALFDPALSGPVNVVAPEPVTSREFAKVLGRVLSRPAFLPVPRIAIDAAFGEMGRETVLASTRARPAKLLEHGYEFEHPSLEEALRFELGR